MPREESIAESAKQRSLRVPLDHYERPDLLVRAKWKLSALAAAIAAIYIGWVLLGGKAGQQQASPGPLAAAHAGWNNDCLACHQSFQPLRADAVSLLSLVNGRAEHREALDASCIKCHNTPVHHAAAKPGETPSCAACHRDHLGHSADIVRPTDAMCLGCHRDIPNHRNGPSGLNPHLANITGFGPADANGNGPHPIFRSLEKDPGHIKFNHWLHMQPGVAAKDAKKQLKLADLDTSWQWKYASYAKASGLVQLDCSACHQPEAGSEAYMRPIAYEEHCRACHRLELKVADGAAAAEVPHGLSAERLATVVSGMLLAVEQKKQREMPKLAADESGALPLIPGKTLGTNLAQKISADALGRRVLATREITTKCMECHYSRSARDASLGEVMDVLPPQIPQFWLRHARFDHRAHRHVECKKCHVDAFAYEQSDKPRFLAPPAGAVAARDGQQVMIAGLDECAKCHAPAWGQTGGARHDCAECHNYHGGDHPFSGPSQTSLFPASSLGKTFHTAPPSLFPTIRLASLAPSQTFVGPSSCASAGCHGDVRGGGPEWRSAFITWATVDPHAQAFEVLWTFRGREMTRLLDGRPKNAAESGDKEPLSDAEHFQSLQRRCVGCHATPPPRGPAPRGSATHGLATTADEYALGVSCESCHGPAGEWLHPHYLPGFDPNTKGFVNTKKSLNQRAATCMKCHVGPSDEFGQPQIVDHDLIAAGHPQLSFEFHAYFQSKPAHWNRLVDEAQPPGLFHFASWLAGQAEQRKQARSLAEVTETIDFAQLDCTSCHHALAANSWRQNSRVPIMELASWPSIKLPESTKQLGLHDRVKLLTQIYGDNKNLKNWEGAIQSYLAAVAFLGDLKSAETSPAAEIAALKKSVTDLGKFLATDCFAAQLKTDRLPSTYDSPTDFAPAPLAQRVGAVHESLKRLEARLGAPLALMIVQQLNQIQSRHGYLPRENLVALADRLAVPLYRIEEVVSFFPHYRKTPPPQVEVHVCRDMSCHLRGSSQLIADLQQELAGDIAAGRAAVCGVSCLGRCDRAPAVRMDRHADDGNHGDHHEPLSYFGRPNKEVIAAAKSIASGHDPATPPDRDANLADASATWQINVYAGKPREERYQALKRVIDAIQRGPAQGDAERDRVIQSALKNAVLLGMGGAGGQAFKKWCEVREAVGERKYVVCNADESEPGTFKDRELLLRTPYLVVEGVLLAGIVLGATQGYIYIRHEYEECIASVRDEIAWARSQRLAGEDILGSGIEMNVEVFVSPGGYICGEQTALIGAIEDKRAEPRNRPPELQTNGLWDMPTLVNNVETLAWAPAIVALGEGQPAATPSGTRATCRAMEKAAPDTDKSWYGSRGKPFGDLATTILGSDADWQRRHGSAARFPGMRMFSISGDLNRPGVFEVENGITVGELIDLAGGIRGGKKLKAMALSGPSGGFTPAVLSRTSWPRKLQRLLPESIKQVELLSLQMHINYFRVWDLMLGAGIVVYAEDADLVEQALACQRFYSSESCGKCVPCRIGSMKLTEIAADLVGRRLKKADIATLSSDAGPITDLSFTMVNTAICGLGTVAPNPLVSLLRHFPSEVERYVNS